MNDICKCCGQIIVKHKSKPEQLLTYEEAHKRFSYDPETGIITNRKTGNTYSYLSWVGTRFVKRITLKIGYECICVMQHRLAWFLQTGAWPKSTINHIDGNPCNNKWSNLEDISMIENTHKYHGVLK